MIFIFNNYISTSEFAKIVGVSKHTLFYYDKEGIFSPEKKDENGFRFYSLFQVEVFFMIKSLTDMGVSLSIIKEHLQTRSAKNSLSLLTENEKILEEKIRKLNNTKRLLKEKKNLLLEYMNTTSDVFISNEQKEILYVTKSIENEYYIPYANHIKNSNEDGFYSVGHIIKNDDFNNKTFFDYYFSKTNKKGSSTLIKSAGNYLNYYHKTGYFTIDQTYEKLFAYAKQNHIKLGPYFFEYMILDELSVSGIDKFVIKISILIKETHD